MTSVRTAHRLALLLPLMLLAGAWTSQLAGGLAPCEMCHWQRWPHYAAVGIALIGFVVAPRRAWVALAAAAIAVSGAIGVFHAGVEYGWWQGVTACSATLDLTGMTAAQRLDAIMGAPLVRCDRAAWTLGGVSLAGFNALFSLAGAGAIWGASMEGTMMAETTAPQRRPGDRHETTEMMIRVDQAGEYGATRIYAGQLAVLGDRHPASRAIHHMAAQEERHRAFFDKMIAQRGVRPTLLQPFWNVAGFALGAATAAIGPDAAMACTAAVETEIDKHYSQQLAELGDSDPELSEAIADFQAEELEHRDHALAAGAENAFGYPVLSGLIRLGCKAAIAASKRI